MKHLNSSEGEAHTDKSISRAETLIIQNLEKLLTPKTPEMKTRWWWCYFTNGKLRQK